MNPDEYKAVHRAAIMWLAAKVFNPSYLWEGSFKSDVEFDSALNKPVFFINYFADRGLTAEITKFFEDTSLVNFTYEFENQIRDAQFIYKITKRDNNQ